MDMEKDKVIITKDLILKGIRKTIVVSFIYSIPMCSVLLLAFKAEGFVNFIATFLFLFLVFTLPFGYIVGLRGLISSIKTYKKIKKNEVYIINDTISKIYIGGNYAKYGSQLGQIVLKDYSSKTGNRISIGRNEYYGYKQGQRCVLIFSDLNKKPVLVYPGNKYELENSLKEKIIGIEQLKIKKNKK